MKNVTVELIVYIFFIILGPLLTFWALNTLSEQAQWGWQIPHNLWTYLAYFCLKLCIFPNKIKNLTY